MMQSGAAIDALRQSIYTWEGLTLEGAADDLRSRFRRRFRLDERCCAGRRASASSVFRPPKGATPRRRGSFCSFSLLVLLPVVAGSYIGQVMMLVGLYILMGMGLNLEVGLAGLLDLGFVAFFAVGAYTTAILTADSPHALASYTAIPSLSYWAAMPIAVLASIVVGVLFGIPVLGVRGDYLAVATMGLGEIVRVVVQSDMAAPLLGGAQGILQIPKPRIGGYELADPVASLLSDPRGVGDRRLFRLASREFAPGSRLDGGSRRRGRGAGARHQPRQGQAARLRPRRRLCGTGRLDLRGHADVGLSQQLPAAGLDQRARPDHRRRHGQPAGGHGRRHGAGRPAGTAARIRRIPLSLLRRRAHHHDARQDPRAYGLRRRAAGSCATRQAKACSTNPRRLRLSPGAACPTCRRQNCKWRPRRKQSWRPSG